MSHLGDRLSALVDGELNGAELDRPHAHLAGCEQCRDEAAELRRLKVQLRGLTDGAPSEDAMPSGLIAMTGPGGPLPGRRRPARGRLRQRARSLLRPGPRKRLAAGGPPPPGPRPPPASPGTLRHRLARHRRYLVLSAVTLVVGLGTVAFTIGGSGQAAPGPKVTPPVEMYSVEHAIDTGGGPFPAPGSGLSAQSAAP